MEKVFKKKCTYCGKEFIVSKSYEFKKRKYCSHECANNCPLRRKVLAEKGKLASHKREKINEEQKHKISESLKRHYKQIGRAKEDKNVLVDNGWGPDKKSVLNITYGELNKYRKKQLVCEICGKKETSRANNQYVKNGKVIALSVDHEHSTGKFRGLLCKRCNRALGWFELYREEISSYLNKTS